MIKIENVVLPSSEQWEAIIRGCRNPMNSWSKSDSYYPEEYRYGDLPSDAVDIGDNDLNLMKRLCSAGTDHRKFMRMITVYADITAPLYWLKEIDQYKVGTVSNSCSTMHKIHAKEFTLGDFSCEHLGDDWNDRKNLVDYNGEYFNTPLNVMRWIIEVLNNYRDLYLETKDKKYWYEMIQLLPSSYNQRRTYLLNYEVLANIYKSRRNHKLDEWHEFCDWIKTLPYSELITGEYKDKNEAEDKED